MYRYNQQEQLQLAQHTAQFEMQTQRYLAGKLTEDQFRPLRLQNGIYFQKHAPMLRVAVPYGLMSSQQLRMLAKIARVYDKGYCHLTTRQNVQFNWIEFPRMNEVLRDLNSVSMHSIQTSGNCIRNITSDAYAGIAPDEIADPRPYCELIRQWATHHPEFAFLPRKFKIAVSGAAQDRAVLEAHDIGLQLVKTTQNKFGFKVYVGGGLGRTPVIASVIEEFLSENDLLAYLEAILRVYNRFGRRDNKYKARIKILVKSLGIESFKHLVAKEWQAIQSSKIRPVQKHIALYRQHFPDPDYAVFDESAESQLDRDCEINPLFSQWVKQNTKPHKTPGYRAVVVSLKRTEIAAGNIKDDELETVADLADRYSFGYVRITHQQNMVMADVPVVELHNVWRALTGVNLANANINTLTDMTVCPGLDYCSLANAPSIGLSQQIQKRFENIDFLYDIGEISLNISGCMNACTHHHIANIGVLGVDKKGEHFYQVSLGGRKHPQARIGKIFGPAFSKEQLPLVVENIVRIYLEHRQQEESFIETFDRVGINTFKERVYGNVN